MGRRAVDKRVGPEKELQGHDGEEDKAGELEA